MNSLGDDPETGLSVLPSDEDAVIVGELSWVEVTTLGAGTAQRANADKVGYLSLPGTGSRCTAFLIASDVVMTNEHCVSSQAQADGASVSFRRELGVPWSEWQTFSCATFLGDDANLDFALLRCEGSPGSVIGTVALESRAVGTGDALYVIHQNCDYYTTPGCDPTKKLSSGQVTGVSGDVRHNADTLGGSSGAPVFFASSHAVFALHHVGVGGNSAGRGSYNAAVPMSRILPVLAERFPTITLGGTSASAPPPVVGDGFEPNDTSAQATAMSGSFAADALSITSGDVDVFRVELPAGARLAVALDFAHAAGDLDVQIHQGAQTGTVVAKGDSATDDESATVDATAAGTYLIVVYGYNGAANGYDLLVTVDGGAPPSGTETPSAGPTVISVPYSGAHAITTSGELDEFTFTTASATRTIRIDFSHAAGDLDLAVFDASGALVEKSESVTNTEVITRALASGSYRVQVKGYNGATGAYTLSVQ